MDDKANIRLVNAHAKGDRCADHVDIVAQEHILVTSPHRLFEASVVGYGLEAVGGQALGQSLRAPTGEAVDDTALAAPLAKEGEQTLVWGALRLDAVDQVRAVEAGDVDAGVAKAELSDDVQAHAVGG